jgi:hypothetical protein
MKVRMFGSFDGIPEMGKTPQRGWSPAMGSRARGEGARQVKCLIASAGHEWMVGYFDRLPAPVRHRLAQSRHNICADRRSLSSRAEAKHRHLHPRAYRD